MQASSIVAALTPTSLDLRHMGEWIGWVLLASLVTVAYMSLIGWCVSCVQGWVQRHLALVQASQLVAVEPEEVPEPQREFDIPAFLRPVRRGPVVDLAERRRWMDARNAGAQYRRERARLDGLVRAQLWDRRN